MGDGTRRERQETVPPGELATLQEGEVLCDRHRRECYQVVSIDKAGIALQQDEMSFYIPCSLFVSWYGRRLFPVERTSNIEAPAWCRQYRDDESRVESKPRKPVSGAAE